MLPKTTKRPLQSSAPKTGIAKASPGLGSTSKKNKNNEWQQPNSAIVLGKQAEEQVVQFLIRKGYKILATNKKVAGVEVDIIAKKDCLYFFEVKRIRNFDEISFRISKRQQQRLGWARHFWQDVNNDLVGLCYAFVNNKEILILNQSDLCE